MLPPLLLQTVMKYDPCPLQNNNTSNNIYESAYFMHGSVFRATQSM